jgi:hypothetical protein
MSADLELLEAQIQEGQRRLRELHATKHRIQAENRRQVIEQETLEVQGQGGPIVATVTEHSPVSQVPAAGLPTPKSEVDMGQSGVVQLQHNFPPRTELHGANTNQIPCQPPTRDEMFLKGAISSLSDRGPQKVVLFPPQRA